MPNNLFQCSFCCEFVRQGHFAITGPDAIMICDRGVDLCAFAGKISSVSGD